MSDALRQISARNQHLGDADCYNRRQLLPPLMSEHGMMPKRIITDQLPSYGAARRQVMPRVEHWLRRRVLTGHKRASPAEKARKDTSRLRPSGSMERFTSMYSAVRSLCVPHVANGLRAPCMIIAYRPLQPTSDVRAFTAAPSGQRDSPHLTIIYPRLPEDNDELDGRRPGQTSVASAGRTRS